MTNSSEKGVIIGIDLGTTNSLAAIFRDGRPEVIPNALGERLTPSAVSFDETGSLLVGAAAKARVATHPDRTAVTFKRDMGTDVERRVAGTAYRAEALSAMVLAQIRDDVEAVLGEKVREAVVTVPAYFGDLQRQATRDAARIAGIHVERIINEPTAAALAYGLHDLGREVRAVVLDLGGGTFDVTLLEIIEGVVEVQATAGDARLGGEDFTDALVSWAMRQEPRAEGLDEVSAARLREACDRARISLTEHETARIVVPDLVGAGGRFALELALSRTQAEEAFAPVLERLVLPIRRVLRDARARPEDVEEVLLVGGASRMPCIVRLASQHFGRLPKRHLSPDETIALGAAVQAGLKEGDAALDDMVVTDVAPFTMGIASGTHGPGGRVIDGLFAPIIERGTTIPASRSECFYTLADRQTKILVTVYQGEHPDCASNTKLGEYSVGGLPSKPAGEAGVEVRFSYDLNGLLEVETTVIGAPSKKHHLLNERNPGQMSKRQIEAARKALAAIKFHPRDSLPNRTALARAEALFVELRGPARTDLQHYLSNFKVALETQDPDLITQSRDALRSVTEALATGPRG